MKLGYLGGRECGHNYLSLSPPSRGSLISGHPYPLVSTLPAEHSVGGLCLSPFLDWELLQSRGHVLCHSLMCPLSTLHGAEALGIDLLTRNKFWHCTRGSHSCLSLQFLAYDTQLVLGNRKHTISPEDYITGALQIYTDIIYIFTFVLQLVGSRD